MFSFCSNPEYHTWHCVTVSQSFLVFYNLDSFEDFWPISPHPGLSNVFPFKARKELIFHLLGGGSIYTEHLESFCKKFSIASPFINVFDHLFISAWQTFTAIYLLGYNPIPFDFFHCSNCSSPEHRGLFPVTFLSFFFSPLCLLSTSLLSGTRRCSGLTSYFLYPSSRISHFSHFSLLSPPKLLPTLLLSQLSFLNQERSAPWKLSPLWASKIPLILGVTPCVF